MNTKKNYITILSVISAIAVVFLHVNGCFWSYGRERYWYTANVIECLCYFAVPVFFMITGANLIDYQDKYSTKEYFKKRIKKVVIPFIVWSTIALIHLICLKLISIKDINVSYIINGYTGTTFLSVYWFFLCIFGVYLFIPVIASIDKNKRLSVCKYLFIISFVLRCLFPFIINTFKLNISIEIPFNICTDYLMFVLLGYIIDKIEIKKKYRIIIYILGIIGLLIHLIGTYYLSNKIGQVDQTFKGYCNIPSVLYATSIFIFVKYISNYFKSSKILDKFATYTFPIYLIHFILLDIFNYYFNIDTRSIIYRLGFPIILIPICILLTYLLRKIPIVKRIVP